MNSPISALIRTFDSARTLKKTLLSLKYQEPALGEIVVVDSGSTDRTLQIAKQFGCRIVQYPSDRPFNYSYALNLGISHCQGSKILILSSHCVFGFRDIVHIMDANLERFSACGVYCMHSPTKRTTEMPDRAIRGNLVSVVSRDNFDGMNGLWNTCSLIQRASWLKHPFDQSMPAAEDQEWALWHYEHSSVPTVCIRNAGVYYLNPHHSHAKEIRDRVVLATRVKPDLASWRAIFNWLATALGCLARGNARLFVKNSRMAWNLALSRIRTPKYTSRYY